MCIPLSFSQRLLPRHCRATGVIPYRHKDYVWGTFQIKIKSDKLMQCVGVAAGLGARRDRGRGVHADVLFDDSDDSGSVFDSSSDDSDSDDDSDDDHFDSRHDFASEIRGMYVP